MTTTLFNCSDVLRALVWVPIPLFLISAETFRLFGQLKYERKLGQMSWSVLAIGFGWWLLWVGHEQYVISKGFALMALYGVTLGICFGALLLKTMRDGWPESWPRANNYFRFYVLCWSLIYIVFPSWYWPTGTLYPQFRLYQLGLLLFFSLVSVAGYRYLASIREPFLQFRPSWEKLKTEVGFWVIALIFVVIQFPRLFSPVEVGGDEVVHLVEQIKSVQLRVRAADLEYPLDYIPLSSIFSFLRWTLFTGALLCLSIGVGARFSRVFRTGFKRFRRSSITQSVLLFLALAAVSSLYVYYSHFYSNGFLFRWVPLSKYIGGILYLLFGIDEFWLRAGQVFFNVSAAYLLFKTIPWTHSAWVRVSAAAIFLFSSLNYPSLHYAYIDAGAIFFMILPVYYFLRYCRNGSRRDLVFSFLTAGLGMTYKRPVAIVLMIITAALFIKDGFPPNRLWRKLKTSILPVILGASLGLPWIFISGQLIKDNYGFTPSHYLSLEKSLAYPVMMWEFLPVAVSLLFPIGLGIALLRRRCAQGKVFILWILFFWLFLTGMRPAYVPYFRISIWLVPAVAFLSSLALESLLEFVTRTVDPEWRRRVFRGVFVIFIVYSAVSLTPDGVFSFSHLSQRTDVYSETMKYMKQNVPFDYRVYSDLERGGISIASGEFHRIKHGLDEFLTLQAFPPGYREAETIGRDYFDAIYSYMQINRACYALFSRNMVWQNSRDRESRFMFKVSEALEELDDQRFKKIRTFSNSGRTTYLYSVLGDDHFQIKEAMQDGRWREVPGMVLMAREKKTITPDFADESLMHARGHVGKEEVSFLQAALVSYSQNRFVQSLDYLNQARNNGLDVSRMLRMIWDSEGIAISFADEEPLSPLRGQGRTLSSGLTLYDFSLTTTDGGPVRPGSKVLFQAYVSYRPSLALDVILFVEENPIARGSLKNSLTHSKRDVLCMAFPVVIPLSVQPGKKDVRWAVVSEDSDDEPAIIPVGQIIIEERDHWLEKAQAPVHSADSSANLLLNRSFEEGWTAWPARPDSWVKYGVKAVLDQHHKYSGSSSLRIEFSGGTDPHYIDVTQVVNVVPNAKYKLSFYTKSESLVSKSLPVIGVHPDPGSPYFYSKPLLGTNEWTRREVVVETSDDQSQLEIRVVRLGAEGKSPDERRWTLTSTKTGLIRGSVWFDQFELVRIN